MEGCDTKTKILDATERIIARRGFDIPLRLITGEAGVNVAAVNYHFQSKETLFDAVIARRMVPLNEKRVRLLDGLEAAASGKPLPPEAIIRAFVAPAIEMDREGEHIRAMIGQTHSLPAESMERIFAEHIEGMARRFTAALHRSRPELPLADVYWRFILMVGGLIHALNISPMLPAVTDGLCDPSEREALVGRLVAFFTAGFETPRVKRRRKTCVT
jgi:AcrR family transcriptional regulator